MNAERLYSVLLRAYPASFRSQYGREMQLLFRDAHRTNETTALSFWITMVWDVARSAMPLWLDEWSARKNEYTKTVEVIMKLIGMLAALLGVYGALTALAEAVAGMRGTIEGPYLMAIVLSGVAAALLLIAGVSLSRGTPSNQHRATIALVASLVIIVAALLTFRWMSTFSQLVGVGLPIVLLVVIHWPSRPGQFKSEAA